MANDVINFPKPPETKYFDITVEYIDRSTENFKCVFFGGSPEVPGFITIVYEPEGMRDEFIMPDRLINSDNVLNVHVNKVEVPLETDED